MSATTLERQSELARRQRQSTKGNAVLREFRDSLEDLDHRLGLARAAKRNGNQPGIPWARAEQELGLDD